MDQPAVKTKPKTKAASSAGQSQPPIGTSKAKPENNGQVRCTDVFQKDAAGSWTIINEHCSQMPKAA